MHKHLFDRLLHETVERNEVCDSDGSNSRAAHNKESSNLLGLQDPHALLISQRSKPQMIHKGTQDASDSKDDQELELWQFKKTQELIIDPNLGLN